MTAFDTIMNTLNTTFVEFDGKYLTGMLKWADGRKDALVAFKSAPEYKGMDVFLKHDKMFAMCGGKTWYRLINENNKSGIEAEIRKICKQTIDARNAKIANKITSAGVTEVVGDGEVIYSNDGFNGVFKVKTNEGTKTIYINTIIAGGYNIQCMHYRTLVKVK